MPNTAHTQLSRNVFTSQSSTANGQQPLRGVWQDNPTPPRVRAASPQPASRKNTPRTQTTGNNIPRSQKQFSTKRKSVAVTLHMSPGERAELQRTSRKKGLSVSQTGRSFVVAMLQNDVETQQGAVFEAVITKLMRERDRVANNRIAALLIRFAVEIGQVRQIVTNLLPAVPGMTEEQTYKIIEEAYARSKRNLARRYPELEGIIDDLSKWLRNEKGEEDGSGK